METEEFVVSWVELSIEARERGPDVHLHSFHYALKALIAGCRAGTVPHSDAAVKDTIYDPSVEGVHDEGWTAGSS